VLPIAILALALWMFRGKKPGPQPGPVPRPTPLPDNGDNGDGPAPEPAPEPEKTLSQQDRAKLATLLSGLGYPATPNNPNIPYSSRVMWVQDFRKVRNKVSAKLMTRVWPLGSPTKQKRVNKGLSQASLAAASWAYGTQSAGIAWNSLVTQARGL
jgi:hypothetical protein